MSKEIFIDFRKSFPVQNINTGVTVTGADTTVNFIQFGGSGLELRHEAAAGTTLLGWTRSADGLVVPGDATDAEGFELCPGIISDNALPGIFKVGTDAAFEMWVEFQISATAAYDVCLAGFRKVAAYADIADAAAAGTAYEDVAFLNNNAGDIYSVTRLAAAAATLTDTTNNLGASTNVKLGVKVSSAGVCTFEIDGASPVVNTNTLTLATDTVVMPVFKIGHTATAGTCTIKKFYCDLQ